MQLVIEVPDMIYERFGKEYRELSISQYTTDIILDAFCNGTPLPKGHGRLIDADTVDKSVKNPYQNREVMYWVNNARTIIEADKESEENVDVVDDIFGQMRDATEQEQKSVSEFVESMSTPTGVNFYDDGRK